MLVTGTKATESYIMQIFTPPPTSQKLCLRPLPWPGCTIWGAVSEHTAILLLSCLDCTQVLITGSEATENYIMQIFTPPYLTGNPNRPTIVSVSSQSPAYGGTLTIVFGSSQAAALTIQRVVLNRCGGVTHSTHFDARQVCPFLQNGPAVAST